jgi:hypothetical protein
MTFSSVEVSSPKKCDNGLPSLGIAMLELADQLVLVVMKAFPTPRRLESIRTGEPRCKACLQTFTNVYKCLQMRFFPTYSLHTIDR